MEADALDTLLRDLHGDMKVVKTTVSELSTHVQKTNGLVAELNVKQLHQEGALNALRWIFVAVIVPLLGIGVAVAGIVLTFVVKG